MTLYGTFLTSVKQNLSSFTRTSQTASPEGSRTLLAGAGRIATWRGRKQAPAGLVMIKVYRWNIGRRDGKWVDPEVLRADAAGLKESGDIVWVDLESPTPEEEELVFRQFFPVHSLSLDDITFESRHPAALAPHLPKVEEFPDYLFVIVNPLNPVLVDEASDQSEVLRRRMRVTTQLSAVMTRCMLITHHTAPLKSITDLRGYLD